MTTDSAGLPPNGYPHEPLDLREAVISSSGLTMEVTRLASILILMVSATSGPVSATDADGSTTCPQNVVTPETPAPGERTLLLDEAGACMHAGQPVQAIALFSELIRIDPRDAFSYMNRGTVRIAVGEIESGMDDYNAALNLRPDLMEAWYNRGNVALLHLHRFQDAIGDFSEAIRLKSDFAPAYCGRGFARMQLGQYDGALADYNQGVECDPKQAYCHFNRANLYLITGEYQKAIVDFTAALNKSPADALTLSKRGQAYEGLGQREQALADYRAALQLDPKLESAKEGIGRLGGGGG
jgi:tetratricopeptide (TPR) repeat protein